MDNKFELPEIELINLDETDVVDTSGGTSSQKDKFDTEPVWF